MRPTELVLTDTERRLALRRIVGFDRLTSEELAAVAERTRRHEMVDGTLLAASDEPRVSAHFVLSGAVEVQRDGRLWTHAPPRPLLDLFWLARDSMPLELRVRGGAVTLELAFDELEELLAEHFPLWMATTQALAGALVDLGARSPTGTDTLAYRPPRRLELSRLSGRLLALRHGLAFAAGAIDALAQLAEDAVEIGLDAGRTVWRAGDDATFLIVPVEGGLRGVPADELGALGGLEMMAERPRPTTVETVTRVRALRVEREPLLDLLEDHHGLARDCVALLAAALIRAIDERAEG
jgi:CRP-like cAMP-binding protein